MNAVNEEGRTPLHEAAMVGNILMIRELLRYFPDANIRDIYGNRALDLAVNAEVGYILGEYNRLEDQALADFVYSDHPMTSVPSAVFHHEDLVEEDAWIAQLSLAYDREVMLGEMVPSDKFFIDSKPSGL